MSIFGSIKSLVSRFTRKERPNQLKGKYIEHCFSFEGKDYYKFKNDYDLPQDRFAFMMQFYNELDMKLTSDDINAFMDAIVKCCTPKVDESIDLPKILDIAKEVKYRSEWLFEPDSFYRLCSCIYFDLKEDVTSYDISYNKDKIESWKKKDFLSFLLQMASSEVGKLSALSKEDLQTYLKEVQKVKEKQSKLVAKK